jgi:hypothetical protein
MNLSPIIMIDKFNKDVWVQIMIYLIEAMLHQSKSGSRATKLKHPNSKQTRLWILNNAIHILFNEAANLMCQELFIFRWLLRLNNGNTLCIISTSGEIAGT